MLVVVGSLLGEWAGILQWLPRLWFWFGNQGWEYLEIGRVWQVLLALGLLFWFVLLWRTVAPARRDPERARLANFFLIAAVAIPVFYLPALFFDGTTHYTIVDTWRFWIIHLWVEGFFEFFVTVIVGRHLLSSWVWSSAITALRAIYLDAILYFGGGLIGTGHHWYLTGQTELNMALSAIFSALEVVPLTLITLDAWDFVTRHARRATAMPSTATTWTFYFLMAVGFWNFIGAGVFGFLINTADRQLLRDRHHPDAQPRPRGDDGRVRHARRGADGLRPARDGRDDAPGRGSSASPRCGFWGLNIGLRHDGGAEPVPGRRPADARRDPERLLARAQPGLHGGPSAAPARMAAPAGRPGVHLLGGVCL